MRATGLGRRRCCHGGLSLDTTALHFLLPSLCPRLLMRWRAVAREIVVKPHHDTPRSAFDERIDPLLLPRDATTGYKRHVRELLDTQNAIS